MPLLRLKEVLVAPLARAQSCAVLLLPTCPTMRTRSCVTESRYIPNATTELSHKNIILIGPSTLKELYSAYPVRHFVTSLFEYPPRHHNGSLSGQELGTGSWYFGARLASSSFPLYSLVGVHGSPRRVRDIVRPTTAQCLPWKAIPYSCTSVILLRLSKMAPYSFDRIWFRPVSDSVVSCLFLDWSNSFLSSCVKLLFLYS